MLEFPVAVCYHIHNEKTRFLKFSTQKCFGEREKEYERIS